MRACEGWWGCGLAARMLKHLGDRAWRYGRMRRWVEKSDDGEVYAVLVALV